ncbi:MAG: SRPBCC domain-containing protein [Candidatus Aminicenantes bacterium]|nr:MAG: SRPBCC domain-containing protein [Candidatus Aminicenantes bacterium]
MSEDIKINRSIIREIEIAASIDEAWSAWTTKEGIQSFFAPDCNVDLKVFGTYEIFFSPDAEPGKRGAEGNRILTVEPYKMFSFTWDAPAYMPHVRKQRTSVVLKFKKMAEEKTKVFLCHSGWGDGEEWDRAFDYFSAAWDIILKRLLISFEKGPIDWDKKDYPKKQD